MITTLYVIAICLFIILSSILCFIIVIQEGKNTGLGASFGGDPTNSLFGTSTADVLKKITAGLAIVFFTSCVFLSIWTSALGHKTVDTGSVMEQLED